MKTITLTQGYEALVDDCDYDDVARFKWFANQPYIVVYACRNERVDGHSRVVYMHRHILGLNDAGRSIEVDHINGDGVDNRRQNLRVVSHANNIRNRTRLNSNSKTGVRNVMFHNGKYVVCVTHDYVPYWYGAFDTLEEAAAIAEQARRELFS